MLRAEEVQYGMGDGEPIDEPVTEEEARAHIKMLLARLDEQAGALRHILEHGYSQAADAVLQDRINMLGEWRPVLSNDLPYYLEQLAGMTAAA